MKTQKIMTFFILLSFLLINKVLTKISTVAPTSLTNAPTSVSFAATFSPSSAPFTTTFSPSSCPSSYPSYRPSFGPTLVKSPTSSPSFKLNGPTSFPTIKSIVSSGPTSMPNSLVPTTQVIHAASFTTTQIIDSLVNCTNLAFNKVDQAILSSTCEKLLNSNATALSVAGIISASCQYAYSICAPNHNSRRLRTIDSIQSRYLPMNTLSTYSSAWVNYTIGYVFYSASLAGAQQAGFSLYNTLNDASTNGQFTVILKSLSSGSPNLNSVSVTQTLKPFSPSTIVVVDVPATLAPQPNSGSTAAKLNNGQVAGIIIGAVLFSLLLAYAGYLLFIQNKKKVNAEDTKSEDQKRELSVVGGTGARKRSSLADMEQIYHSIMTPPSRQETNPSMSISNSSKANITSVIAKPSQSAASPKQAKPSESKRSMPVRDSAGTTFEGFTGVFHSPVARDSKTDNDIPLPSSEPRIDDL